MIDLRKLTRPLTDEERARLFERIHRTPLSRLAMITVGEGLGMIPRGTHDHAKFITPDELTDLLADAGMGVSDLRGLSFSPGAGFHLSDDTSLNYLLTARRASE